MCMAHVHILGTNLSRFACIAIKIGKSKSNDGKSRVNIGKSKLTLENQTRYGSTKKC